MEETVVKGKDVTGKRSSNNKKPHQCSVGIIIISLTVLTVITILLIPISTCIVVPVRLVSLSASIVVSTRLVTLV
jgi:hypothetical protein